MREIQLWKVSNVEDSIQVKDLGITPNHQSWIRSRRCGGNTHSSNTDIEQLNIIAPNSGIGQQFLTRWRDIVEMSLPLHNLLQMS